MKRIFYLTIAAGIIMFSSCSKDDDKESKTTANFTVTIENITEVKDFLNGGTTEGITPGTSISSSFDAGKGHYLSFATMLAQSNDLIYAFDDMGVELYDNTGAPTTGDLTSMISL